MCVGGGGGGRVRIPFETGKAEALSPGTKSHSDKKSHCWGCWGCWGCMLGRKQEREKQGVEGGWRENPKGDLEDKVLEAW